MHVLHVVGARPNFMKVAPVHAALAKRGVTQTIVHTGQHYDAAMSDIFFHELGIPEPDINLEVGSKTHSVQTAEVMIRFEPVLLERQPDWVLVYGDVNSTVAAALVCAKLLVKIAHVEAGLRSRDRTMPEEINRLVTDQIANLLLTPSEDGDENLRAEGIPANRIVRVGNVMIDTLLRLKPLADGRWPLAGMPERFALLTMHRPSNVDDVTKLERLLVAIAELSERLPIVFPIHPRTREQIKRSNLRVPDTLKLTDPLGYLDFMALQARATLVITDSGGVQEETTALGIPCLTLRANTERPVTVTIGTNILIGDDLELLRTHFEAILDGRGKRGAVPPLWDGRASERIADALGA
ncbi:MAG TPA: UDP-N-acetylglucosamine 2-epimerase (non-hydrolyzing) [Thermoanaerobaculia bacterium]|nr:UDP-N-acetylglucosamine 2-epimerase (non-hydrolyzing) [Thermoanaerobaculia bacterium]